MEMEIERPDETPYLLKLRNLAEMARYDKEGVHGAADKLLCELLVKLGYPNVVADFQNIDKWYS